MLRLTFLKANINCKLVCANHSFILQSLIQLFFFHIVPLKLSVGDYSGKEKQGALC